MKFTNNLKEMVDLNYREKLTDIQNYSETGRKEYQPHLEKLLLLKV